MKHYNLDDEELEIINREHNIRMAEQVVNGDVPPIENFDESAYDFAENPVSGRLEVVLAELTADNVLSEAKNVIEGCTKQGKE